MPMIDYKELLLNPNYLVHADTDCIVTDKHGNEYTGISAIDKTFGIPVSNPADVDVQMLRPSAMIRMGELDDRGIPAHDLDGGQLYINGKSWYIESHSFVPTPEGELNGEIMLYLMGE